MFNQDNAFGQRPLYGVRVLPKRKVFVSYHHGNDQEYYNLFSAYFSDSYDVIHDNSLDRRIDSVNTEYVMRRIREDYLTGTSCTIVLCGADTFKRKYVDWEIKATLDKKHALLGVHLPTSNQIPSGIIVPDRFCDNYQSGFARFASWESLFDAQIGLSYRVEEAVRHAQSNTRLIVNNRQMMQRNR